MYKRQDKGRAAFLALSEKYDGPAGLARRATVARADLADLYYSGETALPWDKFSTSMKKAFKTLADAGEAMTPVAQRHHLLGKITCQVPGIVSIVVNCRMLELNVPLDDIISRIGTIVTTCFPSDAARRKRRAGMVDSRGGRGGRGRGRQTIYSESGIDC